MRENEYWAEQSSHLSSMTIGCCVCGNPWGSFSEVDSKFYCWQHMPPGEGKILS